MRNIADAIAVLLKIKGEEQSNTFSVYTYTCNSRQSQSDYRGLVFGCLAFLVFSYVRGAGMDTTGEKIKEDVQDKRGWKEYKQP